MTWPLIVGEQYRTMARLRRTPARAREAIVYYLKNTTISLGKGLATAKGKLR
jgi:hypothetical protein